MEWIIIAGLGTCVAVYLLYINGYMVTQVKRAVMYVGSMRGKRASFSSCTGFTRRVVRFKESRTYHFVFTPELIKGEVSVELLDADKQIILRLDGSNQSADMALEQKSRYYLVLRFKSATGKYTLSWD